MVRHNTSYETNEETMLGVSVSQGFNEQITTERTSNTYLQIFKLTYSYIYIIEGDPFFTGTATHKTHKM